MRANVPNKAKQAFGDAPPSQVFDAVLEIADLFHNPEGKAYADLRIGGRRETHLVGSGPFKTWLRRMYRGKRGRAPSQTALDQAVDDAKATALDEKGCQNVFLRTARGPDGAIYVDLGDETWRAIRVSKSGWTLVDEPPVRFRRTRLTKALPEPSTTGSLDGLRSLLNVRDESQFVLAVSFMLMALHPDGPYPFLAIRGAQGTAKTTFAAIVESMVDPGLDYPRAMPKSQHDAAIAAQNSHLLSFDNVSEIDLRMSDFLCRLSTGASTTVRKLYSDDDEAVFQSRNPVILNGITEVVSRPDLSERCIFLALRPIDPADRRLEKDVRAEADAIRPEVLGALLDAMAFGLNSLPSVSLENLPRMADFALWATACEERWFSAGAFNSAYARNQADAIDATIDANVFTKALRSFIDARCPDPHDFWQGTCGNLLTELNQAAVRPPDPDWPKTESGVSRAIDRAIGPFLTIGITISRGHRTLTIRRVSEPDASSISERSVGSVGSVSDPGGATPDPMLREDATDASDASFEADRREEQLEAL